MLRIRFHGRGGQGMKTASRILGTAFFLEGYEVQDAPRYGAERRGAPIFAYVRADRKAINERGVIANPDLVIVADDTLVPIPAAGVLAGIDAHTVLLINSSEEAETWQRRLSYPGPLIVLPGGTGIEDRAELRYIGATCAGAAARLLGSISKACLEQAIREELGEHGGKVVARNLEVALAAYEQMAGHSGIVNERPPPSAESYTPPEWIDFPFETARVSAPAIHAGLTSVAVKTGLWRTMRPIIDYERCKRCHWVCGSFCPDAAISVDEKGYPHIDYEHCKGCLICLAQCPAHAINAIPEHQAQQEEAQGDPL